MKSLLKYTKECLTTPMNTIGIGNIQDSTDFISLPVIRKNKKQNKSKNKLKE